MFCGFRTPQPPALLELRPLLMFHWEDSRRL